MFIYEAVKNAINDAVPGAIKDAVGWHLRPWTEEKIIKKKIRVGFKSTPIGEIVISNNVDEISPPRENKIEPIYKTEAIKLEITHLDHQRFNPLTGDYETRKDENPMVREVSRKLLESQKEEV